MKERYKSKKNERGSRGIEGKDERHVFERKMIKENGRNDIKREQRGRNERHEKEREG